MLITEGGVDTMTWVFRLPCDKHFVVTRHQYTGILKSVQLLTGGQRLHLGRVCRSRGITE